MAELQIVLRIDAHPEFSDPKEVAAELLADAIGPPRKNAPACGMVTVVSAEWGTATDKQIVEATRILFEALKIVPQNVLIPVAGEINAVSSLLVPRDG